MKISNRTRVALAMLIEIARKKEVTCATLASVAHVSHSYAEQMLALLRGAGMVKGRRGPGGGYLLARPIDKITISHIIEAVEKWRTVNADEWALVTNQLWLCAGKMTLKSVL